ncbi:hypothetical protein ACKWTF_015891 [Chironomus riparius]
MFTILKNFAIICIFLTFHPHSSVQLVEVSKLSTIEATCVYKYELDNIYTCDLLSPLYSSSTDILEITVTHLENYTDADVQIVTYRTNQTAYFNGEVLKKFENVKRLNIYGDELQAISQDAFENCQNLETISGHLIPTPSLPPQLFKNCENLKIFRLYASNIQDIPEDLFGMTRSLVEFQFETFNMTSFPEKLFQNMTNLRILDINRNNLTELHPNFLIAAVNLEHVDLSYNKFEDESKLSYALNGHPNLRKLFLHYNNFNIFDFRFFSQFQKLEELNIGNSLRTFSNISWQALPSSLLSLSVSGIGEELPENSFDRLVNLKSLLLSGIGIEHLHKDTFKVLTNLEMLNVISTSIKVLHPELFASLINLSHLDLNGNRIEELPAGIFVQLVNLGIKSDFDGIFLSSNKIERINTNSFGLHPHLSFMSFHQNIINEVEHGLFAKFHPNLIYVDFDNNRCVNGSFSGENLDDNEAFSLCHKNWNEIVSTTSTTTEASTPGSAGNSFKKFEIFVVIFIGFVKVLMNFIE